MTGYCLTADGDALARFPADHGPLPRRDGAH